MAAPVALWEEVLTTSERVLQNRAAVSGSILRRLFYVPIFHSPEKIAGRPEWNFFEIEQHL